MNKNLIVVASAVLGLVFLAIAFVYFTTPAQSLPAFFPGFEAGLTKIHRTHAVAAALLGLASFTLAWFQSGKKT